VFLNVEIVVVRKSAEAWTIAEIFLTALVNRSGEEGRWAVMGASGFWR
jgi:hypothetical protein